MGLFCVQNVDFNQKINLNKKGLFKSKISINLLGFKMPIFSLKMTNSCYKKDHFLIQNARIKSKNDHYCPKWTKIAEFESKIQNFFKNSRCGAIIYEKCADKTQI